MTLHARVIQDALNDAFDRANSKQVADLSPFLKKLPSFRCSFQSSAEEQTAAIGTKTAVLLAAIRGKILKDRVRLGLMGFQRSGKSTLSYSVLQALGVQVMPYDKAPLTRAGVGDEIILHCDVMHFMNSAYTRDLGTPGCRLTLTRPGFDIYEHAAGAPDSDFDVLMHLSRQPRGQECEIMVFADDEVGNSDSFLKFQASVRELV